MNDCCEKCRFWKPVLVDNVFDPKQKTGDCRKRSPSILQNDGTRDGVFPSTDSTNWCGEFEMREDVVKEEKPANPCVECGKGTKPDLGYVPFYSGGGELKFIHQTCANERFKRGEKIYQ